MKRIIFSIALLFVAVVTKAQTISWNPYNISSTVGTPVITSSGTEFTFDSHFLYANYRLDPDGHTIHYNITAKNIPYNPGDIMGEFQNSITTDSWPTTVFFKKFVLWNAPLFDPAAELESYPTGSTYSYSGSCDIDDAEDLQIHSEVLYWNDLGYADWAGIGLFPQITR